MSPDEDVEMTLFAPLRLHSASILALLYVSVIGVADASLTSEKAISELLEFRRTATVAIRALETQAANGTPLSAGQLEQIHENVVARSQIKDELLKMIAPALPLVNHPDRVRTDADLFHYLEAMAVGYVLTDNYVDFVENIQKNPHLRHIANEENTSFDKEKNLLRKSVKEFYSVRFHRPTLRGARRFDELDPTLSQKIFDDPGLRFFWTVIENSATFSYLQKQNPFKRVTYDIGFFFKKVFGSKRIFGDILHDSLENTLSALSKAFGNSAGKVQYRRGYLFESLVLSRAIPKTLRPGDILLEKTPFRLTDRFIPGYWGHNAIWLGTEDDLRELGVWDHPKIQAIADRIRAGQVIIEALRPGVTTNTFSHFLDIDDLAILRHPKLGKEEIRNVVLRAASQYGKQYDFAFDVETQDTLVCSELIFMAYTGADFKLDKVLGRYTINPDAIAQSAVDGFFDVLFFAKAGEFQTGNLRKAMRKTLKDNTALN